jgi:glutamine phosphoribosylpyrophosphate amidotransferase
MAAAVDLPVALVISVVFNAIIVFLWMNDFGRTPVELDGKMGERRLARARELARTGTFVARIDDEVLANMSSEQLEGLAQRASRRARAHDAEGETAEMRVEVRLRVKTRDPVGTRPIIENRLEESTKRWSVGSVTVDAEGTTVIDYMVLPKKSKSPEQLLALVRAAGGSQLVDAEVS